MPHLTEQYMHTMRRTNGFIHLCQETKNMAEFNGDHPDNQLVIFQDNEDIMNFIEEKDIFDKLQIKPIETENEDVVLDINEHLVLIEWFHHFYIIMSHYPYITLFRYIPRSEKYYLITLPQDFI